ncbi:Band 4.1-like protein 4 [Anabarilius grahami]|uniref:Band 4.1-like protein 4 n=1 Tax=Anabarilius grahami TaxID=495550 RepID=A0A3N0Z9Q6_ANAGA|nr:Band 4.1-like protein 4 [Anabarilius grahami]
MNPSEARSVNQEVLMGHFDQSSPTAPAEVISTPKTCRKFKMSCFCSVQEEFYCEVLLLDESKLILTTQQQGIKGKCVLKWLVPVPSSSTPTLSVRVEGVVWHLGVCRPFQTKAEEPCDKMSRFPLAGFELD